jgi:Ankyrin repeats (3 copies)/Ankyrin repeat
MSDSKELSALQTASQRLFDSDDRTTKKFCHSAADVSVFEDALQQCSTEHFLTEAALSLGTDPDQETVQDVMKSILWELLYEVVSRNDLLDEHEVDGFSWSLDGYSMVARIAKSILSSWCIDKSWIDDTNYNGYTIFMQAAKHGHTSIVELLLAHPRVDLASIDQTDEEGWTVLMLASQYGHTLIVELLLADCRVDEATIIYSDGFGWTALMCAASNGHASVVELLLADPRVEENCIDHTDDGGWTALMYASRYGHASTVELLLADARVDNTSINRTSVDDKTAFMLASERGHTSIVELLLSDPRMDQASINHTRYGRTALWYAAISGHCPILKLLISDIRTSWDSIVQLTVDRRVMKHDEIPPLIIAELTRRQMCVIYPSANSLQWPVPVQSDAKSGDAESTGPVADESDDTREGSDGIAEPVPECALITSFFKSDLFDVNALRIIREYATYTV